MYDAKKENLLYIVLSVLLLITVSVNSPGNKNLFKLKKVFVRVYIGFGSLIMGGVKEIKDTVESYLIHRKTYMENIKLKREIAELKAKNFALREEIKKLSNFAIKGIDKKRAFFGEIIFWDIKTPYNFFLMRTYGEKKKWINSYVVDEKDNLVGKITSDISNRVCSVLLITNPDTSVSVFIGRRRAYGIMFGKGEDECEIRYLKITEKISIGDKVFTSGFDGVYDENILVGEVIGIEHKDYYKTAIVKPYFLKTLLEGKTFLSIISSPKVK